MDFYFFGWLLWVVILKNDDVSGLGDVEVGVLKVVLRGFLLFVGFSWKLFFKFEIWLLVWNFLL